MLTQRTRRFFGVVEVARHQLWRADDDFSCLAMRKAART
jgi:hypothetical protein